jgi:hypothetical protein
MSPDMAAWQPTPSTPIGDCRDWFVRPRCRCGHAGTYKLADLAAMYDKRLTIGQLGHRFRCQECRQKPLEIDLLSSIDPYAADRPDEQAVVVLSGMFLEHIQLIERKRCLTPRVGASGRVA